MSDSGVTPAIMPEDARRLAFWLKTGCLRRARAIASQRCWRPCSARGPRRSPCGDAWRGSVTCDEWTRRGCIARSQFSCLRRAGTRTGAPSHREARRRSRGKQIHRTVSSYVDLRWLAGRHQPVGIDGGRIGLGRGRSVHGPAAGIVLVASSGRYVSISRTVIYSSRSVGRDEIQHWIIAATAASGVAQLRPKVFRRVRQRMTGVSNDLDAGFYGKPGSDLSSQ